MKIAFENSTRLHLIHPIDGTPLLDSDGKPMIAVIHSKNSPAYKNKLSQMVREENRKSNKDKKNQSYEETVATGLSVIEACVERFENLEIETEHGKLDPENISSVLVDAFWIKDQIDSAIIDDELFFQRAKKS